jgi:hypothetical protein
MPQSTRKNSNGAAYQASHAQCFRANWQNFQVARQNFAQKQKIIL